ncbi:MAG: porin [Gemmatimonadales bacterium]|nr:porin [Gemmatimonadales bacterium]
MGNRKGCTDILTFVFVVCFCTASAVAQDAPELVVCGFADFQQVVVDDSEEGDTGFFWGQVEVDIAASIDDCIDLGVAMGYDPAGESFVLGAMTIDFRLFGDAETHFNEASIEHAGIIIGQFDVPFGIDWLVYPSIDRQLVTGPIAVAGTHDGWNDLGMMSYLENGPFNAVFYVTNGLDSETETADLAFGSRLGFLPTERVEVGVSYASVANEAGDEFQSLLGVDGQLELGAFSAKGEFISHKLGQNTDHPETNEGYYAQGLYRFEQYSVFARYGNYSPAAVYPETNRLCLGGGWVLREGAEIRCEYQFGDNLEDLAVIQYVVGF